MAYKTAKKSAKKATHMMPGGKRMMGKMHPESKGKMTKQMGSMPAKPC